MERPYVEELRIQSYGCIRDATFRLTPLHALIGPNDSGKSTVLRALRTVVYLAGKEPDQLTQLALSRALQSSSTKSGAFIQIKSSGEGYHVPSQSAQLIPSKVRAAIDGAQLLRLDPDALRKPCSLIPEGRPLRFADERGTGLPAIYDAIVTRDIQGFLALNAEFTRLFPDEVTVVTRSREHGTRATLMKDTADFEERSKVYALGELWLSYANGEDEKPLLEGGPRP